MPSKLSLRSSPRLFITSEHIQRLRRSSRNSFLRDLQKTVSAEAEEYLASSRLTYDRSGHNAHLVRAREVQKRVWTLLVEYLRTGELRFRDGAVADIRRMAGWKYWSWIRWREGNSDPNAIFDLSYGENSATLALAWDILKDTLSEEERNLFVETAQVRALRPFLRETQRPSDGCTRWYCHETCNWNTVCAGGGGMLALAMYEQVPEAAKVLARAETSIDALMRKGLAQIDSGWSEGVGYWNYAFRYAFLYLLSWENALGRRHPLMRLKTVCRTLDFPLLFSPNGRAAAFSDNNRWTPMPFHLAAARALDHSDVVTEVMNLTQKAVEHKTDPYWELVSGQWPWSALLLLFYPEKIVSFPQVQKNVLRLYRGLDWGVMADQWPRPGFSATVRGGSTRIPHANRDLLSWNLVVGDEAFVRCVDHLPYLDTTFGRQRWELFDLSPQAKNVFLINGAGLLEPGFVKTTTVNLGTGMPGIRMDATDSTGMARSDVPVARFCGRLFVMLDKRSLLIVDRLSSNYTALFESRMHTPVPVAFEEESAVLKGRKHRVCVRYASTAPASLFRAEDARVMPVPGETSTMLRWITNGLQTDAVLATLVIADSDGHVCIDREKNGYTVRAQVGKKTKILRLTPKLRCRKC